MKIVTLVLLLTPAALAFTISPAHKSLVVLQSRPDSSGAVEEAFRQSKEFGADSAEARVAWDVVEEMDGSDTSAAFSHAEKPNVSIETEYQTLVCNLASLMQETANKLEQMKDLTAQLEDLEVHDPKVTKPKAMSDDLAKALAEAKAADDVFGSNSDESSLAWAEAEQVSRGLSTFPKSHASYRYRDSAQNKHHMYSAVLDPQSLEAALEAFGKIQHLSRLVTMESNRMDGDGGVSP